jgi:hypothetical protein
MIMSSKSTGLFDKPFAPLNDEKANSQLPQPEAKLIKIKLACR